MYNPYEDKDRNMREEWIAEQVLERQEKYQLLRKSILQFIRDKIKEYDLHEFLIHTDDSYDVIAQGIYEMIEDDYLHRPDVDRLEEYYDDVYVHGLEVD